MCQHVLWVILRYFPSSIKSKVKITKNRDTVKEKSSKLSSVFHSTFRDLVTLFQES